MSGTFQDICWNIVDGFRDAILGSLKLLKMDQDQPVALEQKPEEPKTTLARRRAEKQKTQRKTLVKESEPKVINRVLLCCAWNGGVFWMSILIFNYILLPSLQWMTQTLSGSMEPNITWLWMGAILLRTFHTLCIRPWFVVVCLWSYRNISKLSDTSPMDPLGINFRNYLKTVLNSLQFFLRLIPKGSTETNIIWLWMGPMLSWTFHTLWILPLFVLSKIVNCFWFADVADLAYRRTRGRPQLPNISVFIADMLFSILLQVFFLIQGTAASFIPIPAVGHVISILHMSLLYSLYSFEYKWINMGWELHRRLSHIENKWSYFLGFGLPMAVLTVLSTSFFISGCVFSILFPIFIVSANEADDMHKQDLLPLKLFYPVVAITNSLFNRSLKQPGSQGHFTPSTSTSSKQTKDVTFR